MVDQRRVPPGRAGRLWLSDRLRSAHRGADLLDRKLRILRGEQDRLHLIAARAQDRWGAAVREAQDWLLRAALLGGQRELSLCEPDRPATVAVTWGAVMGIRYPVRAECEPAPPPERSPGTAALVCVVAAYGTALRAAGAHAAAQAACRAVDAEIVATRRRLRAITMRRIPQLEEQLHQLTAALEEAERAELVRLMWAGSHAAAGGRVDGRQEAADDV